MLLRLFCISPNLISWVSPLSDVLLVSSLCPCKKPVANITRLCSSSTANK